MGQAQSEISIIMGTLSSIYTFINRRTLLKPATSSPTWSTIVRNMHRLLVLRGLINEGDRFPEDPWELFLREFGASCSQTSPDPPSILVTSPRFGGSRHQSQHQDQGREQQQSQNAGSGRHIRFQLPQSRHERERCWQ